MSYAICLAQIIIFNHRSHFQLIIRHTCNLQILIFLIMKKNKFELFNNILTHCQIFENKNNHSKTKLGKNIGEK
jgi:hypothetical protein